MVFQSLLNEVEQLHGISARLGRLADEHPLVGTELLSIAGHVHGAATLLAVVVATKLGSDDGVPHI